MVLVGQGETYGYAVRPIDSVPASLFGSNYLPVSLTLLISPPSEKEGVHIQDRGYQP